MSTQPTLIDYKVLKNENCYGGCGIPKATLRIKTSDLIKITNAQVLDFTESSPILEKDFN
ncbi:MAG: hypothetical protein JSS34_01220 [Proteobacteria bacterium]|nr:hypothetical protein [Pseudomonadota bacterium]